MVEKYLSICPKCKKHFNYGPAKGEIMYCELCGAAVISKCPKCGKVIQAEDAKFCRYCGANYLHSEKS